MADAQVTLRVLLESAGIKPTEAQMKKLQEQMKQTAVGTKNLSKEQNKLKRNLEGTAQRSGRAGKDFSRMSQGMGGLVQAYATVAANVFALSSAFLVLRRAADLRSQIISAEGFSERFGVSVTNLTKRVQEASGGALSFAEALGTVNKAVSAGVGTEQIESLTQAATKAAQTFGGTANEALNRFISASQRGRVEIIQTLGVVIKTEQAYKDYAATIGKTAQELTAFDRQQAILNATIEESARVFDGVVIDPNPFQQLLTTLTDVKDTVVTTITDGLTPLVNAFNKSKAAAAALIALIISSVGGRIFPQLASNIQAFAQAGLESTRQARIAILRAKNKEAKLILETEQRVTALSRKELLKRAKLFREFYSAQLSQHKSFGKSLLDENKKVNAAILTEQRAAIARELKAREKGKGLQAAFVGISTRALRNESNRLTLIAKGTQNAAVAQAKLDQATKATNNTMKVFFAKTSSGYANLTAQITKAGSALKSGFAQGFRIAEGQVVRSIRAMNVAWLIFVRDLATGSKGANTVLSNFSRAFGRTAGVVIGSLSKLLSFATSAIFIVSSLTLAWDLFGRELFGISDAQKRLNEAFDDLESSLKDITDRTNRYVERLEDGRNTSIDFVKGLEFLRGTLDSTLTSLRDFNKEFLSVFDGTTLANAADRISVLTEQVALLNEGAEEARKALDFRALAGIRGDPTGRLKGLRTQLESTTTNTKELRAEFKALETSFQSLATTAAPALLENFVSLNRLFESQGINTFNTGVLEVIDSLNLTTEQATRLRIALQLGDFAGFAKQLSELENAADIARIFEELTGTIEEFGETFVNVQQQIAATRGLQDVNNRIGNFVTGIDKLRAASVPNKEIFNFLLDIETQLEVLRTTTNEAGNVSKAISDVVQGKDLANIQSLLNIGESATLADAIDVANQSLDIYKAVINDSINASNELKIISTQIKSLKEEELTTDERRLDLIDALNKKRIESERLQLRVARNNIRVARDSLAILERGGEGESIAARQLRSNIRVLEAEVVAREKQIKIIEQNLDREREIFKIRKESLDAAIAINKSLQQVEAINKSISLNEAQDLRIRQRQFKLEEQALDLSELELRRRIQALEVAKLTVEQRAKQRATLEAELRLIEAQNRELERRRLLLRAEEAEQAGVSIFNREGMALAASFFVEEVRNQVRDLKTTFEILGRGFVDAINNTFDTAVENLLEGGKDFGYVMVETIKEQLRNVFGEALKTQIRAAFAGIFQIETEESRAQQRHQESLTASEVQTFALEDNTEALRSVEAAFRDVANKISPTAPIGPGGPRAPGPQQPEGITPEKIDDLVKGNTTIADVVSFGNEIATQAKEENTKGLFNIFGILGQLIGVFASFISSNAAGGISSLFGGFFGSGGMIPGGTNFTARAGGGVTSGPELALIGEGRRNEAVVPLPNNREIPVDLRGATGDTINIEQKFDFRGADASAIPTLRREARAIEERTFNRVFSEINKGGSYAKMVGRR